MGTYFYNGDDISDRNLDRGWAAMASELERMVEETRFARTKIEERMKMRAENFNDSGGAAAFPHSELVTHLRESDRLTKQHRRCNMLIQELGHRARMMQAAWTLDHG